MDRFLKIVGIVVLAFVAFAIVGKLLGFLISAVFWIALIAGGVWAVTAIANKSRNQVGPRR
ncbi:hypothetical protein [Nakamurella leprariae]|uniref:Uncharacterized protein n=1 Tax=Nakamurella leprariae TaxID=2803911 RepID=A0A938Y9Y1_9ACTN|nr:hypothetical protein [Nakamurella leprariae]MBM9466667.1 hypothetical protein [Nakamurella leprariae]